jgi:hypothetical protein
VLGTALDLLRVRQYFNVVTMTRELVAGVHEDAAFLDTLRSAVLALPLSGGPQDARGEGLLRAGDRRRTCRRAEPR